MVGRVVFEGIKITFFVRLHGASAGKYSSKCREMHLGIELSHPFSGAEPAESVLLKPEFRFYLPR